MRLASLIVGLFGFSLSASAGWIGPSSVGSLDAGWKYVEGQTSVIQGEREIVELLAGRVGEFANPGCLKEQLLNSEVVQANLAVGNLLARVDSLDTNRAVRFTAYFGRDIIGIQPTAVCKLK